MFRLYSHSFICVSFACAMSTTCEGSWRAFLNNGTPQNSTTRCRRRRPKHDKGGFLGGGTWGWKLFSVGEASFLSVTWSRIFSRNPNDWTPFLCPLPIPFSYFKRFGNGSGMGVISIMGIGMVVPLLGLPRITLDPGHQCIKTKTYRRWTSYPPSNQKFYPWKSKGWSRWSFPQKGPIFRKELAVSSRVCDLAVM